MSSYPGNAANQFGAHTLPDDLVSARAAASVNPAHQSAKDEIERLRQIMPSRLYYSDLVTGSPTLSVFNSYVNICEIPIAGLPVWFYNQFDVVVQVQAVVQFHSNVAANTLALKLRAESNNPTPAAFVDQQLPTNFEATVYAGQGRTAMVVWNTTIPNGFNDGIVKLMGAKNLNNGANILIESVQMIAQIFPVDR